MVPAAAAEGSSAQSGMASHPISLQTLNSLAMHAKIRLMEIIKVHLIKVVEGKNMDGQVTPALLETYSRLLVWLGTRNFQCMYTHTHTHTHLLCTCVNILNGVCVFTCAPHSPPDSSSVQVTGMGRAAFSARDHCV